MTYRELLSEIELLEEDQLDMIVMIDVDEEFYDVKELDVQELDDRLKDGHPYLVI